MPTDDLDEPERAALIHARLDRLPATRYLWTLLLMLSLGGVFEFYDLFLMGYIGPGLVRSGMFTSGSASLLGHERPGGVRGGDLRRTVRRHARLRVSPRIDLGRRAVFTYSLLWYSAATCVMAFQTTTGGVLLWRAITGVGIGVELVTIDTYIAELMPKHLRGRAFAVNQVVQFSAVPFVAFVAWILVPRAPLGVDGWRWVVLIGSASAILVWFIRRAIPESPRWLIARGRLDEAERVTAMMERRVASQSRRHAAGATSLSLCAASAAPSDFAHIFDAPYRSRTLMLMVFNFAQTVGYYGFASWVPTLLMASGIKTTASLGYSFAIALSAPARPSVDCALRRRDRPKVANRLERLGDCRVRAPVRAPDGGGGPGRVRRAADVRQQLDVRCVSHLSIGTVPDTGASAGGGIRLFVEPVQRNFHEPDDRVSC